jgi:hypothetical protein
MQEDRKRKRGMVADGGEEKRIEERQRTHLTPSL